MLTARQDRRAIKLFRLNIEATDHRSRKLLPGHRFKMTWQKTISHHLNWWNYFTSSCRAIFYRYSSVLYGKPLSCQLSRDPHPYCSSVVFHSNLSDSISGLREYNPPTPSPQISSAAAARKTDHWYIQYIPRNMHTVLALLCFVVVIHWLIFPYPSGLLHWHCGNLTIAPVPAK